jgi:hypothetical protein
MNMKLWKEQKLIRMAQKMRAMVYHVTKFDVSLILGTFPLSYSPHVASLPSFVEKRSVLEPLPV